MLTPVDLPPPPQVREGELSLLSRRVAEREDDMMWREFRDRLYYNLGLVSARGGTGGFHWAV